MAIGELATTGTVGVVVPMFLMRDDEGGQRYYFALANAHDGTCG